MSNIYAFAVFAKGGPFFETTNQAKRSLVFFEIAKCVLFPFRKTLFAPQTLISDWAVTNLSSDIALDAQRIKTSKF
jgi:hypothetical protein